MKTFLQNTLKTLALIAAVCLAPLASAQNPYCGNPGFGPILPPPAVSDGYFLGVTVSTVEIDVVGGGIDIGEPDSGPVVAVAPGYGEAVYGQRINTIVPNSPAFHAGLEPGDILIDANGFPMDSLADLQHSINTSEGILEMKVLDSRSGNMVWVVAETDPTKTSPLFAAQVQATQQSVQRKNRSLGVNNGSNAARQPRTFQTARSDNMRQSVRNAAVNAVQSELKRRLPIRRGGRN